MTIPDLTRNSALAGEPQGPESVKADVLQTFGPTVNESGVDYAYGTGAHRIVVFDRVSADIAVGHSARAAAFYRRLNETPALTATDRLFKDSILRSEVPVLVAPALPVAEVPADATPVVLAPSPAQVAGAPFGIAYFGVSGFGAI